MFILARQASKSPIEILDSFLSERQSTAKKVIEIIAHYFKTIIFEKKKITYNSQKSLISPHCDESTAPA